MQVPTAAELPLKRNKTLLIYVGGLVGLCVSCFPASPVPLCPAFLFPFINEWSGSVSPCSLQKVLFAPLSTALLLILWYSLLPIFCKAKQSVSVGFPPFLPDHVQWLLFQWKPVCGTKFCGKNTPSSGWIFPVEISFASHYPNNNFKFFLSKNKQNLFYLCSFCSLILKILIFLSSFQTSLPSKVAYFFLYSLATKRVFLLEKSHENNWILDAGTEYSVDELGRVSRWKPRVDGRMQPWNGQLLHSPFEVFSFVLDLPQGHVQLCLKLHNAPMYVIFLLKKPKQNHPKAESP